MKSNYITLAAMARALVKYKGNATEKSYSETLSRMKLIPEKWHIDIDGEVHFIRYYKTPDKYLI